MNNIWLETFNSATTFGVLTVIAVGILLLLAKRTTRKSSKR